MTKHPHPSVLLVFFICIISCLCWITGSAETTATSSSSALLDQLVQARCGPTGHAMWVYQGFLIDPVNGETIAPVQGLELIRRLPNSAVINSSDSALQIHKQQQQQQTPPKHQHTFLTRRLFLYQDPQHSGSSKGSSSSLLKSIRLRPNSPERKIPMEQTVTVFDSATTFTAPPPVAVEGPLSSNANNHQEWHVQTEWPNGKSLWATAHLTVTPPALDDDSLSSSTTTSKPKSTTTDPTVVEYTIYARPGKQTKQPTFWNQSPQSDTERTATSSSRSSGSSKSVSPPRSALIQFGPSTQESNNHRFGARETYQYTFRSSFDTTSNSLPSAGTGLPSRPWRWIRPNNKMTKMSNNNNNNDCRVKYTRYGEGPLWYGPGRYCSLELTGRRVHSYEDIPPTVAQVAAEYVPGFLSVHTPIQSTEQGQVALKWFRESNVQVMPPLDDDDDGDDVVSKQNLFLGGLRQQRIQLQRFQSHWQKRVLHTAQRFRTATTFSNSQRKNNGDD